jgi:phosphoglycolate phosphatase-like HAD superfamily hydrolase
MPAVLFDLDRTGGLKLTSRYSNLNRRRRRESQTLTGHLRRTARLLDVGIRNCVVAGDSVWDLLAAVRQSAFRVGFLSGGYGRGKTGHSGALRVFSDAADRLMHIERLGLPGK